MITGNGVSLGLNGARRFADNILEARLAKLERLVEGLVRSQHGSLHEHAAAGPDGAAIARGTEPAGRGGESDRQGGREQPEGSATQQVALAGSDGETAERLLAEAKRQGSATLSALLGRALRRHLEAGQAITGQLFDDAEMAELAKAFEATCATADLLGRARIRERQNDGQRNSRTPAMDSKPATLSDDYATAFGFDNAPVSALTAQPRREFYSFADVPAIKPFPPQKALAYFRRLVPSLDVHPERFGAEQQRRAFTLAARTSLELKERVHKAIGDILASGDVPKGEGLVKQLLERTGCSRANPSYSEMVVRTNLIDAYQQGAQEELRHPDVLPDFPAWAWVAVDDNRLRPSHRKLAFDEHGRPKYYSSSMTFQQVRDMHGYDGFNDRCNFRPIHKSEWAELQRRGARFSTFGERHESVVVVNDPVPDCVHLPSRDALGKSLYSYFTERLAFHAGQRFAERLDYAAAVAEQESATNREAEDFLSRREAILSGYEGEQRDIMAERLRLLEESMR